MQLAEATFKRKDYILTSPYGRRTHPITKKLSFHYGTDFGTKLEKWEQYALEEGFIVNCGVDTRNGNAIFAWVEYPRLNLRLLHYHLDQLFVVKGQSVNNYTVIGTTGTTGFSTDIHLHLGVKRKISGVWTYINPMSVDYKPLESDLTVDGIWDRELTEVLQILFKTTVDSIISGQTIGSWNINVQGIKSGMLGSQLIRAIQKWLGIKVNGKLDKPTIMALQRKMGTPVDGFISKDSQMVRELKRRINEGTLL